jgi:radical SAM-linked protein
MPDDDRRPPSEPRQRWRIVFRRGEAARFLAHLDAMKLWERALRRASIPVASTEGFNQRPRIVFAAPLPLGMLAEREIVDIVLSARLTRHELRLRLERDLPAGFDLVDLYDVWLHAPSVASRLATATYRIDVAGASPAELSGAIDTLLAADRLDRTRTTEKRQVDYDLRPLVLDVDIVPTDAAADGVAPADGVGAAVRMRLRHAQDGGTGRPEEVVAALGDHLGTELSVARIVRERLGLVDDPEEAETLAG